MQSSNLPITQISNVNFWNYLSDDLKIKIFTDYHKIVGELPFQFAAVSKHNANLFSSKVLWKNCYNEAFGPLDFTGDVSDIKQQYYYARLYKDFAECKRPDQKSLLGSHLIKKVLQLDPRPKWADFYYAIGLQYETNSDPLGQLIFRETFNNNDHRAVLHVALLALLKINKTYNIEEIVGNTYNIILKLIDLDKRGMLKARRLIDLLLSARLITLPVNSDGEKIRNWLAEMDYEKLFIFGRMNKATFADFYELNYDADIEEVSDTAVYIKTRDYINYLIDNPHIKNELIFFYHEGCQYLKEEAFNIAEQIFLELSEKNFIPAMVKLAYIYYLKFNNINDEKVVEVIKGALLNKIKNYLKIAFKADLKIDSKIPLYNFILNEGVERENFLKEELLQGSTLAAEFFSKRYADVLYSETIIDSFCPSYIPWLALAGNYDYLFNAEGNLGIYSTYDNYLFLQCLAHMIDDEEESEKDFNYPIHSAMAAFSIAIMCYHTNPIIKLCRSELARFLQVALQLHPEIINAYRCLINNDEKLKDDGFLHQMITEIEREFIHNKSEAIDDQFIKNDSSQADDQNMLEITNQKSIKIEETSRAPYLSFFNSSNRDKKENKNNNELDKEDESSKKKSRQF